MLEAGYVATSPWRTNRVDGVYLMMGQLPSGVWEDVIVEMMPTAEDNGPVITPVLDKESALYYEELVKRGEKE